MSTMPGLDLYLDLNPTLIFLLQAVLEAPGTMALEDAPAAVITSYSRGYAGNGIGHFIEMGTVQPMAKRLKGPTKPRVPKKKTI